MGMVLGSKRCWEAKVEVQEDINVRECANTCSLALYGWKMCRSVDQMNSKMVHSNFVTETLVAQVLDARNVAAAMAALLRSQLPCRQASAADSFVRRCMAVVIKT